ncbi:hypothetical protein D9Q98_008675 [Chlorella vulgaris]|uniref:EF-hand domain-containing protein n=1 Tax=Chlorella vulgaris TaxID=3077 RepID=A0A9D4YUG5_CHLVU|nr:hypothetical protein D9Q98_008675 [Chlorella vulgaris]
MDRAALAEEVTHLLNGRTYLTLADLLQLLRRNVTLPVDLTHLGTLWMLDRSHTGRITMDDLTALLDVCRLRSREYQSFELEAMLHGYFTLQMWRAMSAPSGLQAFSTWICNLVLESSSKRRGFIRHGRQQYVGRDAVGALHQLLRVEQTQSLDFQAFFDLLQRCGEEKQLLELSNENQDEWVPLEVVRDLVEDLFAGSVKLLGDICPAEELNWQELSLQAS